ncbi:AP3-complex subunit beta-A [Sesamum angolense]|uniref:AP3-complex subunit beta-A n=1 Tax=Sesamum angolense TaxID=2727404 RepID=A0AAE2C216_9LAMI|nr:AP3-complex subunit beta-A [Sesamum angolense]
MQINIITTPVYMFILVAGSSWPSVVSCYPVTTELSSILMASVVSSVSSWPSVVSSVVATVEQLIFYPGGTDVPILSWPTVLASTFYIVYPDSSLSLFAFRKGKLVGMLLKDNSPGVVGAAAAAFASICPTNFSVIGRNYKRLCETLPDVEEWGQIVLIGILLRYVIAKHGLVRESLMLTADPLVKHNSEGEDLEPDLAMRKPLHETSFDICTEIADILSRSYLEGPDKHLSRLGLVNRDSLGLDSSRVTSAKSNDDVKILLQCTSPLLWSYNSAVVLAAAGVHWIMAPKEDVLKIVKPLLFLLRSSNSSKYVVLCNIQVFAKAMPSLFCPYYEDFFISSMDSYQIKALKLEILSSIATYSSISSILVEFQDYIRDPDRRFAADTVAAIGLCAKRLPDVAHTCLEGLLFLALSESSDGDAASLGEEEIVLVQVIKSIKAIIEKDPPSHERFRTTENSSLFLALFILLEKLRAKTYICWLPTVVIFLHRFGWGINIGVLIGERLRFI